MTEWVEQRICIKFCVKLEHSFVEIISMIQKAAAMGNWWLAASSWQLTHSWITSHVEFLVKHQITQVTQPHYSWDFWLFPKLKSPLKGKRFQTIDEIQENTTGQLMAIGRTVWGPKVTTLKGTEASLSYVQCFLYLVSCIFCNKCLYFSYYMAGYLLDRPHTHTHTHNTQVFTLFFNTLDATKWSI